MLSAKCAAVSAAVPSHSTPATACAAEHPHAAARSSSSSQPMRVSSRCGAIPVCGGRTREGPLLAFVGALTGGGGVAVLVNGGVQLDVPGTPPKAPRTSSCTLHIELVQHMVQGRFSRALITHSWTPPIHTWNWLIVCLREPETANPPPVWVPMPLRPGGAGRGRLVTARHRSAVAAADEQSCQGSRWSLRMHVPRTRLGTPRA